MCGCPIATFDGYGRKIFISNPEPAPNEIVEQALAEYCSAEELKAVDRYRIPTRGADAEECSFRLHLEKYTNCDFHSTDPDEPAMNFALLWTINRMKPAVTTLPPDFLEESHFLRVLNELDMKSSPGVPLCHTYPTNGDFLKPDGLFIDEGRADYLWCLVKAWFDGAPAGPLRVFVKREPHTKDKIREGRLRLIMAVPLVEQVVDQLLFGTQNAKEVELFDRIPCAPGWGITYGGWRSVDSTWFGLDRKAWDYSVPFWLLRLELKLRHNLCLNLTEEWRDATTRRYHELYRFAVFQLSSGARYKQSSPGIVKSGAVNTISTNTHCQLLLHAYAGYLSGLDLNGDFLAMGDDTCQDVISDSYIEELNKIVRVKEPVQGEFCSMKFFKGGRVEPLNLGKHLLNLKYQKSEFLYSTLVSLQIIYGRSSKLPLIRSLAYSIDPLSVRTDDELSAVLD